MVRELRKQWKNWTAAPYRPRYLIRFGDTNAPTPSPPGRRFPWSIAAMAFAMVAAFVILFSIVLRFRI